MFCFLKYNINTILNSLILWDLKITHLSTIQKILRKKVTYNIYVSKTKKIMLNVHYDSLL